MADAVAGGVGAPQARPGVAAAAVAPPRPVAAAPPVAGRYVPSEEVTIRILQLGTNSLPAHPSYPHL
jgi:hypothetical protein